MSVFTFFAGKGGVGKTTCAAAAAVRAASEGDAVLVVSTDPAHSLGDALDLELGAEPRLVRTAKGRLYAAELDADRALSRWLRDREDAIRTIADRGTYLDDEDIDKLLALAFPGVDELVGLVELRRLADTHAFERVVVDTAPTGHLLRLLEMPETLRRLGEVLDDMHAKHRFLTSRLGGAWRPDFADAAIAEIEEEARTLRELLRDPERSSFTWVTLPEELPFRETEDGIRAIEKLGGDVRVIVVNRVEEARDCTVCGPRFADQLRWRKKIAERFFLPIELPALAVEPRGVAALASLATRARWQSVPDAGAAPKARAEGEGKGVSPAFSLPSDVRLVLVGGKGGVGKTTVSGALALAMAKERPSERILVISTDPAHSLGDALKMELSDKARAITKNLDARELDANVAWEKERARYRASIDELFSTAFGDASFDRAVLEDLLDLSPPGIDELLALVTLLDELVAKRPKYGAIIVDTAPTGHTLRLLALPEKALDWVHALMSVILKYRSVVGLGELASDLTVLAKRLRTLIALLRDPAQAAFLAVTRPATLPREETERLAKELRRLGVPLAAIVANAITKGECTHCAVQAAREEPELALLERLAARAARRHRLVRAPAVFPPPRGAAALRAWFGRWEYSRRA